MRLFRLWVECTNYKIDCNFPLMSDHPSLGLEVATYHKLLYLVWGVRLKKFIVTRQKIQEFWGFQNGGKCCFCPGNYGSFGRGRLPVLEKRHVCSSSKSSLTGTPCLLEVALWAVSWCCSSSEIRCQACAAWTDMFVFCILQWFRGSKRCQKGRGRGIRQRTRTHLHGDLREDCSQCRRGERTFEIKIPKYGAPLLRDPSS